MGKRGVSLEEKRERILNIFHTKKTPFTLKQIEKLGSKAGVTSMSIKDVVQGLVDDFLVDFDKIGSTNYYWSFPSKAMVTAKTKLETSEKQLEDLKKELADLEERKQELQAERQESEERTNKLAELEKLKQENAAMKVKLETLKEDDPRKIVEQQNAVRIAKEASIRWTDNTWAMADYLRKKYALSRQDAEKQLKMKSDFDYPEYKPTKKKARKK